MRHSILAAWLVAALCAVFTASAAQAQVLENDTCLGCHGNEGFSVPGPDGKPRTCTWSRTSSSKSVHGKRLCVECHKDITEIPHKPGVQVTR